MWEGLKGVQVEGIHGRVRVTISVKRKKWKSSSIPKSVCRKTTSSSYLHVNTPRRTQMTSDLVNVTSLVSPFGVFLRMWRSQINFNVIKLFRI